jgi:hypothetical protein
VEFTAKMPVEDFLAKVILLYFKGGCSVRLIRSLSIIPID